MKDRLDIFVSGKEGELDDERAVTNEIIDFLGFKPKSSERRVASPEPMKAVNQDRVIHSDIYIGIFGKKPSPPSVDEFNIAQANNIPTLIFVKEVKEGEESRDSQLVEFIKKIESSTTGIVFQKYDNVLDLKSKIIESLAELFSKRFTEYVELKREINNLKSEQETTKTEIAIDISEKLKYRWGVRYNNDFGRARIVDFQIPVKVRIGTTHKTSAKIEGSTKDGFLDLALIDPDGKPPYYWFPDPNSYDSSTDNGKLIFEKNNYQSKDWEFTIGNKTGKYKAIMGIFENKYADRVCIDYVIKEIEVF